MAPPPYDEERMKLLVGAEYPWLLSSSGLSHDRACFKLYAAQATIARRTEEEALLRNEAMRSLAYWRLQTELLSRDIATLEAHARSTTDADADAAGADVAIAPPANPASLAASPTDCLPLSARAILLIPPIVAAPAHPVEVDAAPAQPAPPPDVPAAITRLGRALAFAKAENLKRRRDQTAALIAQALKLWVYEGLPARSGRRKVAVPALGLSILPPDWNLPAGMPIAEIDMDVVHAESVAEPLELAAGVPQEIDEEEVPTSGIFSPDFASFFAAAAGHQRDWDGAAAGPAPPGILLDYGDLS